MLLNRVRLQGFLAHRGEEVDGKIVPIELDFRESGLWLMHGANGSGKSSVFDAITFALFNTGRGNKLAKLVNDSCRSAFVEVEFEHNGKRYLVKRSLKLSKNRESHESSTADVTRWDEGENRWIDVEGVGGKIREWTTKTLQVSYENFVSSVILEQGRADKFLCAAPSERRKQLMQLLELSVYEKISVAANDRRNLSRLELRNKEDQIARATAVAPETLALAEDLVSETQTLHDERGAAFGRAQQARDDAARAARLDGQIAEKIERQKADAEILADAQLIENARREREELSAIMPSLRALSGARGARDGAARESDSAREDLEAARQRERDLAPLVEQRRAENGAAGHALTEARLRATQAELNGKSAQSDGETVRQIEELEAQIAQGARDLEPHQIWLERADSIEARRAQIAQLNEITRVVKPVNESAHNLNRARIADREARNLHEKSLEAAQIAAENLENASDARRLAEGANDELKTERADLNAKLSNHRETLAARDELGSSDKCPTCGSDLDDDQAHARIEAERERLRRDVAQWQARLGEIDAQLRARETDKTAREAAEKAARDQLDSARGAASKAEGQRELTAPDVAEKERQYQSARDEAGEWAGEDLAELQTRLRELQPQTIEADWGALQNARDAQRQIEAMTGFKRAQRQLLPDWDGAKRQEIGELQRDLAGALDKTRAELDAAQTLAKETSERADAAQNDLTAANRDAAVAASREKQSAMAAEGAQAALDAQFEALMPAWKAHRAARENEALMELARRHDELQPLAARADELRAAQQRVSDLESEIRVLREQIADIPAEHRGDVAAAQAAFDAARAAREEVGAQLESVRENLLSTRNQRENWVRCEAELAAAQIEFGRDEDLAKALGSEGLQARIIKRAQEKLRDAANAVLGRLTNGSWQIELREQIGDKKEKELEIVARDDARGGYERTFDTLSGGERFRVAISLAIAIGQMAAGSAPMNTLVIDEGFGALDGENRDLMVENLRHLSRHELKGGRIIVVSHQDDVRESFDYRYLLSRDADGYAKVEATFG